MERAFEKTGELDSILYYNKVSLALLKERNDPITIARIDNNIADVFLRLNQLDYFDKIEADKAAEIKRNTKDGTVDITLKLREKGKQSIGLQGGVSGLAGSFIGLTYQTNNFLGLGETLTFSAQFGDLQRSFVFGFTEPYLFDRPISSGFTT